MADVMAIISKAVFEADAKHAKVGDVLPIDRYTSSHKTLDALAEGGRLFLVTVRPPEELWLVAVLENPKRVKGAWVAKNVAPVRAVSDFQKGLKAKKGRLGMSLQTPRTLSADDAALLVPAHAPPPPPPPAKKNHLVHVE